VTGRADDLDGALERLGDALADVQRIAAAARTPPTSPLAGVVTPADADTWWSHLAPLRRVGIYRWVAQRDRPHEHDDEEHAEQQLDVLADLTDHDTREPS